MLELSDVGLMNKSTEVTRHKAGTKVEWGIHYAFDQTDGGFTLNGLGVCAHEACVRFGRSKDLLTSQSQPRYEGFYIK